MLAACASPYHPVYVSSEGDYYIAERETASAYYSGRPAALTGAGLYPWWSAAYHDGYPPSLFTYYSPNFYPHHFWVRSPLWQHNHYGWYGAYSPWCPPYQVRNYRIPVHHVGDSDAVGDNSALPPNIYSGVTPVVNPRLLRSIDPGDYWINPVNRGGAGTSMADRSAAVSPASASRRSTSISSLYSPGASASVRAPSVSSHSGSRSVGARPGIRVPVYSPSSERH
jgi:hypothetical protein